MAEREPDAVNDREEGSDVAERPATVEQMEAEIVRLKMEAEQNWRQFLHAAADLENYKKQAARTRDDAVQRTRRSLLMVILNVVDNIERALAYGAQSDEAGPIAEGIRMTHRQILETLGNMGVRPFAAIAKTFDARFHEAVEVVPPTEEHPAGQVVAEIQHGYMLGEEVLRPARVRVAREQE